ncbi:MAG: FkbM family methyltransferase [Bacteroidia bacterium]|nr:FkbM family methyltransferase [Bacteroidia bacterium]
MLVKLLRQMLAPLKRFKTDSFYREWLRLSDKIKSIPSETVSSVNAAGFSIRFSDASALLNMFENIFVNECYRFKTSSTKPVIIDCGANLGLSVSWFARNYPGSSIIAFEPDPLLFGILQHNAQANNINADLRNEAVWNTNSELKFFSSKKQNAQIADSGTETVKAVRLKEILETYSQIDLLKIDIEGAEYAVIADCRNELHRVKHVFVECHFKDGNMSEVLALLQQLQKSGFSCSIQTPINKTPFLFMSGFQTMDIFASRTPG